MNIQRVLSKKYCTNFLNIGTKIVRNYAIRDKIVDVCLS
jgi:hypothetical protein